LIFEQDQGANVTVPIISPDEACRRDNLSPTACAARNTEERAQREVSAKLCERLFPDELVLQTACKSNCLVYSAGDGQDCAFSFSRTARVIAPEKIEQHGLFWSLAITGALLFVACWVVLRARRKIRDEN
jgi:hypothetical protein